VADSLRAVLQDVNWARAGLGLPLLDDSAERKPSSVPIGPLPTPEGEDQAGDPINMAHELIAAKKGGRSGSSSGQWKGDTVVNFDTPTSRRTGVDPGLASSPLITGGDPDSDINKYKRRAPTDFLFRWLRTIMKPAAQRRRGGTLMLVATIALALMTLVAIFNYLGRGGYDDPMLDPHNNPNIRIEEP